MLVGEKSFCGIVQVKWLEGILVFVHSRGQSHILHHLTWQSECFGWKSTEEKPENQASIVIIGHESHQTSTESPNQITKPKATQ
jgi:hypothetical protein